MNHAAAAMSPDAIEMPDATRVPERFEDVGGKNFFARFFAGAGFAFGGIPYTLKHASLRGISVIPTLIHIALFVGLLFGAFAYYGDVLAWASIDISIEWLQWLSTVWTYFVGAMVAMTFVAGGLVMTIIIGNILCGPIYDIMSERTEILVLGRSHAPPFSVGQMFKDLASDLVLQAGRLAVYIGGIIIIMVIGLIPLLGQLLAPVLSLLWTWLFLSLQFSDPSFVRHTIDSGSRMSVIFSDKATNLGFGAGAWLCMFVPMLTPMLIVGATRKYLALAAYGRVPTKLTEADKALIREDKVGLRVAEDD